MGYTNASKLASEIAVCSAAVTDKDYSNLFLFMTYFVKYAILTNPDPVKGYRTAELAGTVWHRDSLKVFDRIQDS